MHAVFDIEFYSQQVGYDLTAETAWEHFQNLGDRVGLDPSPYFSTLFYKERYPDWHVKSATAFEDFLTETAAGQIRQPHPLIDPWDYTERYEDLRSLGAEAALHFVLHGDLEGRQPSPGFDAAFYRRCYQDLGDGRPLHHYITQGAKKGYLPRPKPKDFSASRHAMEAALKGRARPILLALHDAQLAGVPILTLDLAQTFAARGYAPVFFMGNAGPLLDKFQRLGPSFILAEGWDIGGLLAGISAKAADAAPLNHRNDPPPALVTTSAAASLAVPIAQAGLRCAVLLNEMPGYIRAHDWIAQLQSAKAAGAEIIASMPRMVRDLAPELGEISQILPGLRLPSTPLAAFRAARVWRGASTGPVFIGAGHADFRKGFDLFLEVARRITNAEHMARFVWLGALDPWAQDLGQAALAEGLALHLPGFVGDSLAWYRAADVYLLTSRQDPGPATAVQAAAMGTPVVGYAAEIGLLDTHEGLGQFVPPGQPAELVAAAFAALEGSTAAHRRALRRAIRARTSFDKYTSALLARVTPHSASG